MKREAHDDKGECQGAGPMSDELPARQWCLVASGGQSASRDKNLRRGFNRYHLAGEGGEAEGERARATAKIEHAGCGSQGR